MSEEKEKTAAELQERERLAKQLEEEKKNLEEATSHLKGDLMVSRVNLISTRSDTLLPSSPLPYPTLPLALALLGS